MDQIIGFPLLHRFSKVRSNLLELNFSFAWQFCIFIHFAPNVRFDDFPSLKPLLQMDRAYMDGWMDVHFGSWAFTPSKDCSLASYPSTQPHGQRLSAFLRRGRSTDSHEGTRVPRFMEIDVILMFIWDNNCTLFWSVCKLVDAIKAAVNHRHRASWGPKRTPELSGLPSCK